MTRPTGKIASLFLAALLALPGLTAAPAPAQAEADTVRFGAQWHWSGRFAGDRGVRQGMPSLQGWMHPEIADAWGQGFRGQGTAIVVVDDFTSARGFSGDLGAGAQVQRHGGWVRDTASLLAPEAAIITHDFTSGVFTAATGRQGQLPGGRVPLALGRLTTINLSYAMFTPAGVDSARIRWGGQEASIIAHAARGRAVVVKAAGNDAVAVGAANGGGLVDQLNMALVGAPSAIFVGALSDHGSAEAPAALASYSNRAGDDPAVQARFLVAGVPGHLTGLNGTSFAAPVVSAYAAVLGSKFTAASPTQIADRLLQTARTDTILGYAPNVHGQGEASIARALAPVAIR